jgi:hypothetical protein
MGGNNLVRVSVCLSAADGPRHFLPVNDTWQICFSKGGRKWNLMWEIMVPDGNGATRYKSGFVTRCGDKKFWRENYSLSFFAMTQPA